MNRIKLFAALLLVVATVAILPAIAVSYPEVKATKYVYVGATKNPTITLDGYGGDATVSGQIVAGNATDGVITATGSTMVYGYGYQKTNALTGDLIGVKGNARISLDSATGKVMGGYFLAGNGIDGGYSVDLMRGIYVGVVKKVGTAKAIDSARGAEIVMDWDGITTTTTTLTGARIELQSGATASAPTNSAGLHITNQSVSGAGQKMGSAILVTQLSCGSSQGFDYGLDFGDTAFADDGLTFTNNLFGTADIRLCYGETIDNLTNGVINFTATTTKATGAFNATGASALDGGITADGDAFAVADTTGIVTLHGGGTIDDNTDTAILNLTETTVRATGILDVTGNSTLVSLDVGGGYGATGSTLTATGTANFDSTVTVGKVSPASAGSVVILGTTSGGITLTPIATGTGATTIQNSAGTPTITLPATTCTLPGLGLANAWTAANTITVTGITDADLKGIYSNVNQTTLATANDLTAVRGNARIDVDSTSGKAIGGYFLAGNTTNGFNLGVVRGIYCGTVTKTPTAADKTWTDVRGIEIVTGNTAIGATYKTDVTNLMGIRLKIGSSTGSGSDVCGDITNGYGVWVDHEQQGLACRTLDAGFYLSATSISGGNAAWAYGLDMSAVGTNMGTADIRLSQGETIDNLINGTIAFGGKLSVTDVITQVVTSTGTAAEYNGIVQTVTVGTNNTGSIVGASFSTNGAADKTSGNIIGLWASADQVSSTSIVSGLITAAYFDLNLGAATGLPTGTGYGVVIENSDWSNDRAYRPKAFVAFMEGDNGATLSTTALFDVGAQGKPVTSAADCTQILNTDSPGAVDAGLRILINGDVYYILMVKGGS